MLTPNFAKLSAAAQARQDGGVEGGKLPLARDVWGAPPSLRNMRYARMHHLKKIKNFLPKGALQKCLGARRNVFPYPTVALDGSAAAYGLSRQQ